MKFSAGNSGLLIVALALFATKSNAHEGLKETARQLTARIEAEGASAELYLERGRIFRLSGDWVAALGDFRRAEKIDRSFFGVEREFASVFSELRNWPAAHEYATSHLARFPDDVEGLELLAGILEGTARYTEAAAQFHRALLLTERPSPESFLARARVLAKAGDPSRALRGLDEGLRLLGQVPALQLKAIELERASSSTDAAIERVERLAKGAARKEHWLVLRGEIELEGDRPADARRSFQLAEGAIEKLRPNQQTTRSVIELRLRLIELDEQAARLERTTPVGAPHQLAR